MMMIQNLVKKDIGGNDVRAIDLALSFVSNHPDEGLYSTIREDILIIAKGSARNESYRKKAICCLSNYTQIDASVLKDFLGWVDKEISNIQSFGILFVLVGLLEKVLIYSPQLAPLVIKPTYSLFEKNQNWLKIKVINLVLFELLTIVKKNFQAGT